MKSTSKKRVLLIILVVVIIGLAVFYYSIIRVAKQIYPLYYSSEIKQVSKEFNLDPAMLSALIYEESKFEADALSTKGAVGLTQILPDTANFIARDLGYNNLLRDDLFKPEVNIRFGGYYFKTLLDRYDTDETLALAAYNAGFGAVDVAEKNIENLPEETQSFVQKVDKSKKIYTTLHQKELSIKSKDRLNIIELTNIVLDKTSKKAKE